MTPKKEGGILEVLWVYSLIYVPKNTKPTSPHVPTPPGIDVVGSVGAGIAEGGMYDPNCLSIDPKKEGGILGVLGVYLVNLCTKHGDMLGLEYPCEIVGVNVYVYVCMFVYVYVCMYVCVCM